MALFRPKIVSLDTATWGLLAKDQTPETQRIHRIFSSGKVIPFFTDTVLMELFGHGNDEVVKTRIAMIRRLPFVTFMKGCANHASVGWLLDLREAEMLAIRDLPEANTQDVLERVRGQIADQFCSGADFCQRYLDEWIGTRALAPFIATETAEVATLAQFPLPGVDLSARIPTSPDDVKYRSLEEFKNHVASQYEWLVHKFKTDGDKGIKDPERAAASFLREICDDMERILDTGEDIMERLLAQAGVERSRLPQKATIDDVSFEGIFISFFKTHERRLGLPPGTLKQFVRQEQVPSWIVWREVARTIRRLQKAEASTLNDKQMMPFALYLDGVEVDKRIRHCIREAVSSDPLMKIVDARVFRRKNLTDLANQLEKIAGS